MPGRLTWGPRMSDMVWRLRLRLSQACGNADVRVRPACVSRTRTVCMYMCVCVCVCVPQVCGDPEVWGDFIVPVPAAHLPGATNLDLDGVFHSPLGGQLPTFESWCVWMIYALQHAFGLG